MSSTKRPITSRQKAVDLPIVRVVREGGKKPRHKKPLMLRPVNLPEGADLDAIAAMPRLVDQAIGQINDGLHGVRSSVQRIADEVKDICDQMNSQGRQVAGHAARLRTVEEDVTDIKKRVTALEKRGAT